MHGKISFDFKVTLNIPIGTISFETEKTLQGMKGGAAPDDTDPLFHDQRQPHASVHTH